MVPVVLSRTVQWQIIISPSVTTYMLQQHIFPPLHMENIGIIESPLTSFESIPFVFDI